MPVAEVWISTIIGFISGAACGIMGMMFYIRNKYDKSGDKKNGK